MSEEEELIEEEEVRKALELGGYSFPEKEEKHTVFTLFKHIIDKVFNPKTGNLTKEELGMPRIPVRTNLEIADYCKSMDMDSFASVFKNDAQNTLSTSLSREGFFAKLAVTTKKLSETAFKRGGGAPQKRGLFKGRNPPPEGEMI